MKKIPLNKGAYALVDDADYEFLKQWCWQINWKGYAVRSVYLGKVDGLHKKATVFMHRILTAAPPELQVDHINCNTLDNQKSNLRLCTNGQNKSNGVSYKNSTSKYRGVSYHKTSKKKWLAQIQKDKKKLIIGFFEKEEDAAMAYNIEASRLFGEFARINNV